MTARSSSGAPMFGRRQLLLGAGTFLAGMAAVTAWTETHPASSAHPTTVPATTALLPTVTTGAPTSTSVAVSTTPPTTTSQPAVKAAGTTPPLAGGTVPQTPGGPATYVAHGPPNTRNVALTFHLGGDPGLVTELMDVLKASGVTSTLFAIGDWLTANPALGHRAVDDGHELGNHTKSHLSMLKLSQADVRAEIIGGGEALIPFIGSIGKWFRPSGTDVPSQVILDEAGRAGYAFSVGYDVDPRDFTEPGAAAVVKRVRAGLHPGAIVSLHFGHRDTIDAWPQILELVGTAGLTPVTISELLG